MGYSVGSWKHLSLGWGAFPTVIPIRQGLYLLAGLPAPSSIGDSSLGSLMWPFWVKPALLHGLHIHKEYSCTLCPGKPWSTGHSQLSTFLPSLLLTVDRSNGGQTPAPWVPLNSRDRSSSPQVLSQRLETTRKHSHLLSESEAKRKCQSIPANFPRDVFPPSLFHLNTFKSSNDVRLRVDKLGSPPPP